ncbi:hypothetical protein [Rhodococcus qingshengii]|uniref:hypothetical protein n=1 Tax=Rhodococcus qingshengii TaxID=334542 RepID=UPI00301B6A9E
MSLYRVNLTQTANHTLDVEAPDPRMAKLVAENMAYAGLCHECSHEIDLDPIAWEAGSVEEVSS